MLAELLCYFIYFVAERLLLSCFIAMLLELAMLAELLCCLNLQNWRLGSKLGSLCRLRNAPECRHVGCIAPQVAPVGPESGSF